MPSLWRKSGKILPELEGAKEFASRIDESGWKKLEMAMPGLKERAKTLNELIASARYLFATLPPIVGHAEIAEARDTLTASGHLGPRVPLHSTRRRRNCWRAMRGSISRRFMSAFRSSMCGSLSALEAATRAYAEEAGVKLGGVAQPLRAALTGRTTSPPIFDVLHVLGRDESLARIADKIA